MDCNNIIIRKIVALLLFVPCIAFSQPGPGQFEVYYQYIQDTENKEFFIKNAENAFNRTTLPTHLKSTKTANDFLDSICTYHFNSPTDSLLDNRKLFNYDALGYKTMENMFVRDTSNNNMLEEYKYEYIYNSTGKINSQILGEWRHYRDEHFIYFSNKDTIIYVDTIIRYYDEKKYDFNYDPEGKLMLKKLSFFGDGSWRYNTTYWYAYDSIENKITETTSAYNISDHISAKTECTYDSLGNKTFEYQYEWQYDLLKWRSVGNYKYEYEYNTNKQITSQLYYYWSFLSNQWNGVFKAEYDYDSNGKRTSHIYYIMDSASNKLLEADKTEYSYNSHNKITLKTNYIWNKTTSNWNFISKDYYYYSTPDELSLDIETPSFSFPGKLYPNPAREKVMLDLQEKPVSQAMLYTINGQFIKSFSVQQGVNTINLDQVKQGVYVIKVQSDNGISVQKLVKE